MSNVHALSNSEKRADEASLWISRLDRELSGEETLALQRWMANPLNKRELLHQAELWDQMSSLTKLSELIPRQPGQKKIPLAMISIAASLLVAITLGAFLLVDSQSAATGTQLVAADEAVYETPVGDHSTIHLTDGSVVYLNTNTRLIVSMGAHERRLVLKRGEIHVDVFHDAEKPFRVFANNRIIEAVGTGFSIKIDDSQIIELLVTDGRVRVDLVSKAAQSAPRTSQARQPLFVQQGERVVLDEDVPTTETITPEEIEVSLSWRDGNLIFRGESLDTAVTEVSRYTQIEFVIKTEELKAIRVAGLFKAGDVEGFLKSLRENFDIEYEVVDDKTISLSRHNDAAN